MARRTKQDLETRRDVAYDDVGDLYVQRNMWLNFVSDNMAHQQRQDSHLQEVNERRLETQQDIQEQIQVMSTKVMDYDRGTLSKGKNPN